MIVGADMSAVLLDVVMPVVDRRAARHTALVVAAATPGGSCVVGRGTAGVTGTPDGRTVFEIGSVTKVFTATLLALLSQEGVVAFDEPVQDLLPDSVRMPVRGRPITLLDLATHRSGLPRLPGAWLLRAARHGEDPYSVFTEDDVWHAAARARRRVPGGRPRYSNFGVGLLGHLLAQRTGTPYEELVVQRICAPLGLGDTVVRPRPADAARTAQGHDRRGRPVPHWRFPVLAAAGALRSTALDQLAFLAVQCAATEPGSDTALHHAVRATHQRHGGTGAHEWCLGWAALRRRPGSDERVLWHNGGTGGFRSFVACIPERGVRVVVLTADARNADPVGHDLLAALAPVDAS